MPASLASPHFNRGKISLQYRCYARIKSKITVLGTYVKKANTKKTLNYSSPACFAHELAQSADGTSVVDPQQTIDVARWRKSQRARLTALRRAISIDERRRIAQTIVQQLDRYVAAMPAAIVSVYWPIKGEPNLRHWMHQLHQRGVTIALPVVATIAAPMVFREWTPGAPMEPGIWNIPIPVEGDIVIPTLVIAPVVGFDTANYRLGNGGGYFDRTLAELIANKLRPYVIGVGYQCLQLPTIFPQPHDIPMDVIITEQE